MTRPMLTALLDRLAIDLPAAAFNGGILFRRDGTILSRTTIPAEAALEREAIETRILEALGEAVSAEQKAALKAEWQQRHDAVKAAAI